MNELSVSDWLVTDKSQIFGLIPGLSFLTGIGLGRFNFALISYWDRDKFFCTLINKNKKQNISQIFFSLFGAFSQFKKKLQKM